MVALHVAPERGAPTVAVAQVVVEAGAGIVGDRHHGSRHRHVSLQSADALAAAAEVLGRDVPAARTRRNVTVSGPEVPSTPGARIQVGDVLLEVVRVAAPCRVMDEELGPGARPALRRRAGSVLRALTGGTVRVGDPVVELPAGRAGGAAQPG
ncbi:MOSC domain-containing protein [Nocardioides perillae]|uniref:MOSC domain-containing protein YiiM n=1 Tax=Nocardioides perillae TaxID=1119534 RepID=A0A7Y9RV33_9ACTN|nr:MOSC domain-containing protein YiiM [Nocardioides perillae]